MLQYFQNPGFAFCRPTETGSHHSESCNTPCPPPASVTFLMCLLPRSVRCGIKCHIVMCLLAQAVCVAQAPHSWLYQLTHSSALQLPPASDTHVPVSSPIPEQLLHSCV